jgi:two-component system sensor histidine kinase UhpB
LPLLIAGELLAGILIAVATGYEGSVGQLWLLHFPIPILIYALAAWHIKKIVTKTGKNVERLIVALFWCAITSLLAATWLTMAYFMSTQPFIEESIALQIVSLIFGYGLGDFIGILLLCPLALIWRLKSRLTNEEFMQLDPKFMLLLVITLLVSLFVLVFTPVALVYIKLVLFALMIYIATQYGWLAVLLTTWVITLSLSIYNGVYQANIGSMEDQAFIIILAVTGLLLSAFNIETNQYIADLTTRNTLLTASKVKLKYELSRNQLLAKEVVRKQELERIRIARDMHDEVGQNITALKTNIYVLDKLNKDDSVKEIVKTIKHLTDKVYDISHDIMYRLRPVTLNQIGLTASLQTDAFVQSLAPASIKYHFETYGALDTISELAQSNIYRVVQESMSNTIKYAQANNFTVIIKRRSSYIFLHIRDNGIGFNVDKKIQGLGITGIQERVLALGGKFKLKSDTTGTRYFILLNHKDSYDI